MWSQVREHASSLQKSLGIRLVESIGASAFAGATTTAGGLAMLADVPRMLRHCAWRAPAAVHCAHRVSVCACIDTALVIGTDVAESLELRSEHAPENEIYDNFTRPLKAEIAAHFMHMCIVAGVDTFDEDEDTAEEYTPLDLSLIHI